MMKACNHNTYQNVSCFIQPLPFPKLCLTVETGQKVDKNLEEFTEWEVEGKRYIKMIFWGDRLIEEKVFFIKEAICTKSYLWFCCCSRLISFPTWSYVKIILFLLFPQTMLEIFCYLDFRGFAWSYGSTKSNLNPCMKNPSIALLSLTLKLLYQAGCNSKKN